MGPGLPGRSLRVVALLAVVALLTRSTRAVAECPSGLTPELLDGLPLAEAFPTRVMGIEPPLDLYRKAMAEPGEIFIERDGRQGMAVLVARMAVEPFWKALNDDDHHDEAGYLPLRASEVIEGEAARSGRRTFQYFKRAGIGRWWVNRMEMSAELYRQSGGRIWELSWRDAMDEYPGEDPPVAIDDSVPALVSALGAWTLIPLGEDCLLIEYVTEGDPGGLLGSLQFMVATKAVRNTLEGMLEMAREHTPEDHGGLRFVRPDGVVLGEAPAP